MKKVLAIALLCAVSSFATWDKFPVKEAGKGEAKVGFGYLINPVPVEKSSGLAATLGARYSIIEGLEASLQIPFPLSASVDGNSCEADDKLKTVCPPSYGPPVIGVRYWLPLGLGIALDVALPLQGDAYPFGGVEDAAKNESHLDITPAVQYSTNLTSELSVGAEVSLTIPGATKFEIPTGTGTKEVDAKDGMGLGIGVEFDYAIGDITPYVGVDIGLGLTNGKVDGTEIDDSKAETTIDISLGAIYKISDSMGADIGLTYGLGKGYEGVDLSDPLKPETKTISPLSIFAHFSYYF